MTYVCYQGNDRDCGFAALRMLLANKSRNKSYLYIKKPTKRKDYTLYDLFKIAKGYGFLTTSFEIPKDDVKDIPKSTIVLINDNHAVYVIKVNKRNIVYFDPGIGKVKMSHHEFEKIFTGYVVECTNHNDAVGVDFKKERITPIHMEIIHYSLISIILGTLLTGFFLIQRDTSIIITMVFLLLFALAELVENWYILKELKFFDKKYLEIFFSRRINQNMDKYKLYCDYKSSYFVNFKLLISNSIIVTAFGILLCLNDYRNLFVFLILLLIATFDNLVFSKKDKDDVKRIEQAEAVAFDDDTTMIQCLKTANNVAGNIALRSSLKKVAYMFVCLCLALGMMLFSDITSTNFIIFHFGIYYFVSEAMLNIVNYFSKYREREIKKAQFLDQCDL